MTIVAIPYWNLRGVIPPHDVARPTSTQRAPYLVSLNEFIRRFSTSNARTEILRGYLAYRERLRKAGITSGFQWLDGSFLENIELIENRSPNDLDVVTFYNLPEGVTQKDIQQADPEILELHGSQRTRLKDVFHVDGFLVQLKEPFKILVNHSTYWYSVWSHRRDLSWKGFLEIDLTEEVAPGIMNRLAPQNEVGESE